MPPTIGAAMRLITSEPMRVPNGRHPLGHLARRIGTSIFGLHTKAAQADSKLPLPVLH